MIEPAPLDILEYKDWIIQPAPPHVPFAFEWFHKDCDPAPEHIGEGPADHRYGWANSVEEAIELIGGLEDA